MKCFPQESHTSDDPGENNDDEGKETLEPYEIPVPDSDGEDSLVAFGDDLQPCDVSTGVWEVELCESNWVDIQNENEISSEQLHVFFAEHVMLASTARKQKVEVRYRDLGPEEKKLFDAAKAKEIKAWIDHGTVQKVSRGTLRPDQIMRCRWILTWKAPEVGVVNAGQKQGW